MASYAPTPGGAPIVPPGQVNRIPPPGLRPNRPGPGGLAPTPRPGGQYPRNGGMVRPSSNPYRSQQGVTPELLAAMARRRLGG